ncbi:DUF7144 family membrane protein [Saccharopolyspora phatthalungensis]|uniref:DUF7144 domain-containing protein n=1 Tax=Saccharopolyspora phatthalungensis TaxID=664693 RepID=A0A840Q7H1_9PSEU|nr:hypothetical protein [Saccharopolyspora phatthalungensis]MBB5156644.1 hypothetical protein [Saccharopolyspora phatthalungensis]
MPSTSPPGPNTGNRTDADTSWAASRSRRRVAAMPDRRSGWLTFAGTLILLLGIFNVIGGFAAFFRTGYYHVAAGDLLFPDYRSWGWILLGLGALHVVVGLGALFGQVWARACGVVMAGLCAVGHAAFLNAFPVWSLLVIAMSVLVIYSLIVPARNAVGA